MKISDLNLLASLNRNVDIPIAIDGQTMRIKLGQIVDILKASVVIFEGVSSFIGATYATGFTVAATKTIFDKLTNKFYAATYSKATANGQPLQILGYYSEWDEKSMFYDEAGSIRKDCLYLAADGSLYKFNGTTLISAGLTDSQALRLQRNTPIRVENEDEMERMIAENEVIEGQIYYTPEE